MSFNCVNTPIISNPVGIDFVIQEIQNGLSTISWLEYSFGKAYEKKEVRDNVVYDLPKVWIGNNEFQSVEPNDTVKSFSFIENFETEFISDWETRRYDHISTTSLSIVVFANLERIDNTRDYIFTEELKEDVLNVLRNVQYISSVDTINKGLDQAYSRWSIETIKPVYYADKYSAFRIDVTAIINSACYTQDNNKYNINNC